MSDVDDALKELRMGLVLAREQQLVEVLAARIKELEAERDELQERVDFLSRVPTIAAQRDALQQTNADLLAALREIATRVYRDGTKMTDNEMRHIARAAIAQVEGES